MAYPTSRRFQIIICVFSLCRLSAMRAAGTPSAAFSTCVVMELPSLEGSISEEAYTGEEGTTLDVSFISQD